MKKVENFEKSLMNLHCIDDHQPPFDVITMTGMVALFQICFEQSWKAMKEVLTNQGYDESKTGSPRMVLKLAFSAGMINNEEHWLQALADRNEVAHSYNEEIAMSIIKHTKDCYISLFEDLLKAIKNDWI